MDFFRRSRLQIYLDDLPYTPGTSAHYIAQVNAQIQKFLGDWGWILRPIRIPLALQVITKPSPPQSRTPPKHDLDNVVRKYVLPRVVAAFAPPSNLAWTVDVSRLPEKEAAWWTEHRKNIRRNRRSLAMKRLSIDGERGFVSVSLVPDIGGLWGPLKHLVNLEGTGGEYEFDVVVTFTGLAGAEFIVVHRVQAASKAS